MILKNINIQNTESNWANICVSNRLPISFKKSNGSDCVIRKIGTGGLAAGLSGISNIFFFGISSKNLNSLSEEESINNGFLSVNISEDLYNEYYNRFSNEILWAWLHKQDVPIKNLYNFQKVFESYKKVNELVAHSIVDFLKKVNVKSANIWIHDYHLFLLPYYLHSLSFPAKIGFFLHVPFPEKGMAEKLPCLKEIVHSLSLTNLTGFHTHVYAKNFFDVLQSFNSSTPLTLLPCIQKIEDTGLQKFSEDFNCSIWKVQLSKKSLFLGSFPIGLNNLRFSNKKNETRKEPKPAGQTLILGVDRSDTIKGLLSKFYSFKKLLEMYPETRGKVKLLQLIVPSREDVKVVRKLKKNLFTLSAEINGRFGNEEYTPLVILYKSVEFEYLVSLYRKADILWVNSTIDGFNLVSCEYLASQRKENPGVLLLSKFTGAHSYLKKGCLTIDPYDLENLVEKLQVAMSLSLEKRQEMFEKIKHLIEGNNSEKWCNLFFGTLSQID